MSSLRLAVFHDLPSGGAKRALWKQVRGLRRLGHRVDAFVPSTADESFLPLADAVGVLRTFTRANPPARESALEGMPSPLDLARWAAYLRAVRHMDRIIGAEIDAGDYDVALVHPSQFTQAPFVLRFLRTPSVYYCHEPLRAAYEPGIAPTLVRLLIRATLGRMDRANVRSATTVAVNSHFTAGRVEAIYGRVPRVNYPAVDGATFHSLAVEPGDFVLTVGALHPLKGLAFLVDAIARVPAGIRPPLWVVSDRTREAERRRLEARAAEAGVKIVFRFRVSDEQLVRLYNRARVVLYAPYREPFGFVPLEAMACGRPVLAVGEGGVAETVHDGETGFAEPRDPDRFASRLASLLDDAESAEAVGQAAAKIVRERWRWDRSVTELANLCAAVAVRRKAATVATSK